MPSIKKLVAKHLKKQKVLGIGSITLSVITRGDRTPGALSGGTNATVTNYPCKGFLDETSRFADGTLVKEGRSKLSILAGTLPNGVAPVVGNSFLRDGVRYQIFRVLTDPARAMHECEVASS